MNEQHREFVSSRGLARSCDVVPARLVSDSAAFDPDDYQDLSDGAVVYVTATQLKSFVKRVLPTLDVGIVLVTGDADMTIPGMGLRWWHVKRLLHRESAILHWFSQNIASHHPKITQMPIGLDYHTLQGEGWKGQDHGWGAYKTAEEQEAELVSIRASLEPIEQRPLTAYASFTFSLNKDRVQAAGALRKRSFMVFENERISREESWRKQGAASFVVSPLGNGADCHRTWEALALGCIPIVRRSFLSGLFDDLPVLIVDSWKDVTLLTLERFKQDMRARSFDWHKLRLKYWTDRFRQAASARR